MYVINKGNLKMTHKILDKLIEVTPISDIEMLTLKSFALLIMDKHSEAYIKQQYDIVDNLDMRNEIKEICRDLLKLVKTTEE